MADLADDMKSARNAVGKAKDRLEGACKAMGPYNPYLLPVSYILEDLEKIHGRLEEIAGPGYAPYKPVPVDKVLKDVVSGLSKEGEQ